MVTVLIGFIHWLMTGGGLALVGEIHPLMRSRELRRPGPFAMNYSIEIAASFFVVHLLFGLIMGGCTRPIRSVPLVLPMAASLTGRAPLDVPH